VNYSNTPLPLNNKTLSQKAVAGTGWSGLATVVRQALSFGSVALLARLLGPSAYGLIGMATILTAFLSVFRDLGTTYAVIQRPNVSARLLSSLFWVNCGIGAVLCLIAIAISVPVAAFFHEPQLGGIVRALAVCFPLTSAGMMHYALLSREMAFKKIAIADLASAAAGYAVAIPAALWGFGVWSLVLSNIANAAVATGMYWKFSGWRPAWEFDREEVRSVARFSLNLSGFSLVNYFSRNADNLIIGRVLGSVELGYYQMAYNLMMYPIQNLTQVLGQVLFPAFARIQNDDERFRSAYIRSSMLLALITFPVVAGLWVVADPLIRTLLGRKWVPAILLFQILAPVGLVQSVQSSVGQIYVAKGRTDWMFRWGAYAGIVCVISFLIGVRWGAVGVATAYCVSYFLLVMYPCAAIPFHLIGLRVRDYLRHLFPQLAVTGLMAIACALWLRGLDSALITDAVVRLTTTVALGVAVYTLAVLRLRLRVIEHLEELMQQSDNALLRRSLRFVRVFANKQPA
jgi:O-antigen/teichoic acid export membrane protein